MRALARRRRAKACGRCRLRNDCGRCECSSALDMAFTGLHSIVRNCEACNYKKAASHCAQVVGRAVNAPGSGGGARGRAANNCTRGR
eukprot:3164439-Prymnesium_polylepis.1